MSYFPAVSGTACISVMMLYHHQHRRHRHDAPLSPGLVHHHTLTAPFIPSGAEFQPENLSYFPVISDSLG